MNTRTDASERATGYPWIPMDTHGYPATHVNMVQGAMSNSKQGTMMTEITKADLKETENNILKSLEPVKEDISAIKLTLHGPDGRKGLVADVNNMKTSAKWVKALAGGGLVSGLSGWFKELIK